MLVMQALAGILLEMKALDAYIDGATLLDIDPDHTLADQRLLVLGYLVTLRQVGIEVILPVEYRTRIELRLEAEPEL